jgi:hypothetical protein
MKDGNAAAKRKVANTMPMHAVKSGARSTITRAAITRSR